MIEKWLDNLIIAGAFVAGLACFPFVFVAALAATMAIGVLIVWIMFLVCGTVMFMKCREQWNKLRGWYGRRKACQTDL